MRYAGCDMKRWTLALLLVACGGSSDKDVKKPAPPIVQPGSPDAAPDSDEPKTTPGADKLSSEECEQLFEHLFKIAVSSEYETQPVEERPTAADIAKAKSRMRGQLLPECLTLTRAELKYECYMAAADRDAINTCDKS
jgi:hypothetical protein